MKEGQFSALDKCIPARRRLMLNQTAINASGPFLCFYLPTNIDKILLGYCSGLHMMYVIYGALFTLKCSLTYLGFLYLHLGNLSLFKILFAPNVIVAHNFVVTRYV